jgi:protein phosphatase
VGSPDNVTVVMVEIVEETPDDVSTAAVDVIPSDGTAKPAAAAAASGAPAGDQSTDDGEPDADNAAEPASERSGSSVVEPASTDPHLGEHLTAEVLREELSSRPHELVGAAASAAETGSIPTIGGRTVARRAATLLTHKAEPAQGDEDETLVPLKPRRWVTWSIAAVVLLVLGVGLWLGYAWTQTRYYVGEFDSRVAIYNGVSQRLGPIQLSRLETVTELPMSSLPPFSQQRVRQTVPANDLYDAQRIVKNLELTGTTSPEEGCPTASASAPATQSAPAPTPADPAASPAAGAPAPTPASPSPSPTPTVTCEVGQ